METFLLGLLTAAVIAVVIVGIGLQYAEMWAANAYSTEHVRLSVTSSVTFSAAAA